MNPQVPWPLTKGESVPAAWRSPMAGWEPWPLTDQLEVGDFGVFRHQAWHSILHHFDRDPYLKVAFIDSGRLHEISFQRDPLGEYRSYLDLGIVPLLVLQCGVSEPPSRYTAHVVQALRGYRETYGRPTWVYAAHKQNLVLRALKGDEEADGPRPKQLPAAPDASKRSSKKQV